MSERKKRSLEERVKDNPILRKRLESILDLAENVDGKFKTADEAEERAIAELRRLGNELLQDWAINQEKRAAEDLRKQTEGSACNTSLFAECQGALPGLFDAVAATHHRFWG